MGRGPRRPKPVRMGEVRAAAKRPPRRTDPARWYWQATIRRDGSDHTVLTGWFTRRELERELARRVATDEIEQPRPTGTVYGLVDQWAAEFAASSRVTPGTKQSAATCARRIVAVMGDVRVDRVDLPTLEQAVDELLAQGFAPSTVRTTWRYVVQIWNWGRVRGLAPDRSLPKVVLPKGEPRNNHYVPTPAEAAKVLDEIPNDWRRLVAEVLFGTGCRVGEVLTLTWDDIRLNARPGLLVNGKTGPRFVPLSDSLLRLMRETKDTASTDATYWHGCAAPRAEAIRLSLRRACVAAGVPRFTTKALRHLAATEMARSGVPVRTAASVLGHSPEVMLRIYTKVREDDRDEAVEALGRRGRTNG